MNRSGSVRTRSKADADRSRHAAEYPSGRVAAPSASSGRTRPRWPSSDAAIAAPTIPASLRSVAGTTRGRTVRRGMNLSAFLLTPPPRMIRFGQKSLSIAWRCSSRSFAQAFHDRPRRVRATAADRRSASRPRISMWPSSVFGTSTPSLNMPEPRPVPRVSTNTTPRSPRPAPKRISARPAASASLRTTTGRLHGACEVRSARS